MVRLPFGRPFSNSDDAKIAKIFKTQKNSQIH